VAPDDVLFMERKCDSTAGECPVLTHVHRKYKKIMEKVLVGSVGSFNLLCLFGKRRINAAAIGNYAAGNAFRAIEEIYCGN